MELAMLLKPSPLVNKKKGDPEQLLKDWEEYIKVFKEFLAATEVAGVHTNPEVPSMQEEKESKGRKEQEGQCSESG